MTFSEAAFLGGQAESCRLEQFLCMDEAHTRLYADEGYGWSIRGDRFWVGSSSPGLAIVSFYGVFLYSLAQVRLFSFNPANDLTFDVLEQLRVEFLGRKMTQTRIEHFTIALVWLK